MIEICKKLCQETMPGKRYSRPGAMPRKAWEHPEDLVLLLDEWEAFQCLPESEKIHLKCVAWLHDVIEDGQIPNDRKKVDEKYLFDCGIDSKIITDVIHLSQKPTENKEAYLQRLNEMGSLNSKKIKCIDRICNLREGSGCFKQPRWERYKAESATYIMPLAESIDSWLVKQMNHAMNLRS